jgi:thymidylate kinase
MCVRQISKRKTLTSTKTLPRGSVRITFDGDDGSGRSLLLYRTRDMLEALGVSVKHTDEHELTAHNVARTIVDGQMKRAAA